MNNHHHHVALRFLVNFVKPVKTIALFSKKKKNNEPAMEESTRTRDGDIVVLAWLMAAVKC